MQRLSLTTAILATLLQISAGSRAEGVDQMAAPPSAVAATEGWGKFPTPIASGTTYSVEEQRGLGACANLADQVLLIATSKRNGISADAVKRKYDKSTGPLADMMPAVIDQVYAHQNIQDDLQYAAYRFTGCTMQVSVPPPRSDLAHICMERRQIASIAWAARMRGEAKDGLYKQFADAKFRRDATRAIIDDVYAHTDPIAETRASIWNSCIVADFKMGRVLYVR